MNVDEIRQAVESGATPVITCEAAKVLLDKIDELSDNQTFCEGCEGQRQRQLNNDSCFGCSGVNGVGVES